MASSSYRDYQRRTEARRLGRPDPVRGYDHESDDSEGDGKKELHHLSVHGHPDATKEKPMWIVQHHHSEDDSEPEEHEFSDGVAMLHHIGKHAGAPGFREEENSEEKK